jgi:epoxyqueuosine reductase
VVLALSYFPGREQALAVPARARVALYARGRDYHRVLGSRLRDLARWLDAFAGCTSRAYVDTGPVLERAWAQRAGVGWIGKNANLLTREAGSWLLLGEILTTAELEPDAGPHADFCGSCTACIDACPTAAIVEAGEVDSDRCISYWTIEHRGAVPAGRRAGIADWIFGCDICQEVCPWNESFARARGDDPFGRREDLHGLDPVEILGMDEATFRGRFSGTALMRATWRGLRRNACIVLGNRGEPAAVGPLGRALGDSDPVVRGHAAWALGRIGGSVAHRLLEQAERNEADAEARAEVQAARTSCGV